MSELTIVMPNWFWWVLTVMIFADIVMTIVKIYTRMALTRLEKEAHALANERAEFENVIKMGGRRKG